MIPAIKLKMVGAVIWVWALIVCGACTQDRGTVIHKRPVEGMEGYKIIIREAQEVEKRVYQVEDIRVKELGIYKSSSSAKAQEVPVESPPAPEEPAFQPLRRQRIPLRRNRYLLLKQQSDSLNIPSD